jgi:sugar lactone lactonase YvrE
MLTPHGVSVSPRGNIIVADSGNHRIDIYRKDGTFVKAIGAVGTGPGQFNVNQSPMDVAVGPDGTIYATDWWGHRIERFSADGKFLSSWGHFATDGHYGFYGPRGIAVSKSGTVYVADTGNKQIAVFTKSGKFLFRFGGAGSSAGQFDEPSSVAVAPNGDVFVADMWNQRIQRFDPHGRYLGSWEVNAWASQSYSEPYITTFRSGNVAVTDPQSGRVLVFTPAGHALGAIYDPSIGQPIGIAATASDQIVVSDTTNSRVLILSTGRKAAGTTQPKP